MPSNIWLISSGVSALARMARVVGCASRLSVYINACGYGLVDVPLRMHGGDGLVLHPGGKALVEPEVVPPLHGDQVAEPLVSHLVRDDQGDFFLCADGCGLGIDQQRGLAVGDGAEVFHCAGFEVGQGDQVELLERIGNAEVGVVVVQHVLGDIDAVRGESNLVGRGADADSHAILFACGALEVADQEGDEIGGHFGCGGEMEGVLACGGAGRIGGDGPVGDGRVGAVYHKRDIIGGLEGRLVKAGEGAARVGGLELRNGVIAPRGLGEIEAAQFVVQDAGVGDGERSFARRQLLGEGESGLFLLRVKGDGCSQLLARGGRGDALESDLCRVERDGVHWLFHRDVDRLNTREGSSFEVRGERKGVVLREDRGGKTLGLDRGGWCN